MAISEIKKTLEHLSGEEGFRFIFENTSIGISIGTPEGSILETNTALQNMLGYSKDELREKNFMEVTHPDDRASLKALSKQLLAGKKDIVAFEKRNIRKDGTTIWVRLNAHAIFGPNKKPKYVITTVEDISNRKKTEEASKDSEEIYRKIFFESDDGFILIQPLFNEKNECIDFVFLKVNDAYEHQTGRKAVVVEGKKAREVAPDLEMGWVSLVGKVCRMGKSMHYENYNQRTNRWFDASFLPFSKGRVGILFRDVTERKKIEQTLQRKQQELNSILDSSPTIIFYKDKEGKFIQVNKAFADALKVSKEHLLGKTVFDIYSPQIAQAMTNDDHIVLKSKRPKHGITEPYESPTGLRWIRTVKVPSFNENGIVTGLIGFSEEITEHKKAENSLVESEEKYRNLVENSKDSIAVVDFEGNVLFANKASETLTGYPSQEITGMNIRTVIPKKLWPMAIEMLLKARMGNPIPYFDYEIVKKDGTTIQVETGGQAISKGGKLEAIQIITRDITERKKAEEELKESEAKYRELVNKLPEMIFEIDLKGHVTFSNLTAIECLGYSKEEIEHDLDANQFVSSEDVERSRDNMIKMFEDGIRQSNEYMFVKKDGTRFPALLTSAPIVKNNKIVGLRGIVVDLSERKEMERRLNENERLAAIGATAGMVGHDIRNPLQSIVGEVFLLKDELASMPECKTQCVNESIDSIEKSISYINKIVADLQDYSRTLRPDYTEINLLDTINNLFGSIDIPNNIDSIVEVDASLSLRSDPTFLGRIFTNLINNAIQAMPTGGKLIVNASKEKDKAKIVVEDNGMGIPENVKAKLFSPMVTTKSKGQGLGLAVVKRLVEALNGTVSFESQEGKGTKFIVKLPLHSTAKARNFILEG